MSDPTIIDKIRKLKALAERAGTEAEAVNATARIQELLTKHNLEIGAVDLRQQKGGDESVELSVPRLWPHLMLLANACNELFDVKWYYRRHYNEGRLSAGTVHFIGLSANVSAACVSYSYLCASVEALLNGWKKGRDVESLETLGASRRELYRSFRYGASERILHMTREHKRRIEEQSPGSMELFHIGNAVAREMEAKMKFTGRPLTMDGPSDRGMTAYHAGYEQGSRVDIHGARNNRMLE